MLELGTGQDLKADILSELGGTTDCESQGSSRGKKDPSFFQRLLCAGFRAEAPHGPPTDTLQQPCKVGMDVSFIKDTETHFSLREGKCQSQASNPRLTAKPTIFLPDQCPFPEP